MDLISLLVALLVLALVIYVVKIIIDMLPLSQQVKMIAYIIVGIVGLLYLLSKFGIAI